MTISVLNEKMDFLGFLDKYLYLRMLLQEVDARKSSPGKLVHDVSVKTLKDVLLCNNNEAVKVRQTLRALEWIVHIGNKVLPLPPGKGRKKLPALLKHEPHIQALTRQAEQWQYSVVKGLLIAPATELWFRPSDGVVGRRKARGEVSLGSKQESASSNIAKLPIVERVILAVLWANASPTGRVEGMSLNAVARQCSLKPSKRFQLAISHLIADGAIVYLQESVRSSGQFHIKISIPTEIQLNPFHPWVAGSTPGVIKLVLEPKDVVDANGPSEMARVSELTGLSTLYDKHSGEPYADKIRRRQHLEAVMMAKDPYNPNGIRKTWSDSITNFSMPDAKHANEHWTEFKVPTNLKLLHDDAIVMQKLICRHLEVITRLLIKYGDLCLSDNFIVIKAGIHLSDMLPNQHKKLIKELPIFAIKILADAENYFKNRVLTEFFKKIKKEHVEAKICEMDCTDLIVFPSIKPQYFNNKQGLMDVHLSLTVLSTTVKSGSEKKVMRFTEGNILMEEDKLSFSSPNDIRDIR